MPINLQDPQTAQLLLSLGGRFLSQSTAPSPAVGFGQALLGGIGDYNSIKQAAMQSKMAQQRMERQKFELDEARRQREEALSAQEREEEAQARTQELMRQTLGGRGMGAIQQLGMPGEAIGMPQQAPGDMYMPAAGYQDIPRPPMPNIEALRSGLSQLALEQAGAGQQPALSTLQTLQAMQPKPAAPFTLSEGQRRYQDGEMIAEYPRPTEPEERDIFGPAKALRSEFTTATKDYPLINNAFGRIKASAESPSPAGDMALIFSYMKMLDPGSTVREGEYATARDAGNIPTHVRSLYNSAVEGTMLTAGQRKDFTDRAGMIYEEATRGYKQTVDEYKRLAENFGVDPENVIFERQLYKFDKDKDDDRDEGRYPPPPPGFRVIP